MSQNLKLLLTVFTLTLLTCASVRANPQTVTPHSETFAAGQLELTIATDKQVYGFRSQVQVFGNLTFDDEPVEEGLVAVQVIDPSGYLMVTRTVNTGTTPSNNWRIEIIQVATVDAQGNPKTTFKIGETARFKVTLKNNLDSALNGWITVAVLDADMIPIGVPRVEGAIPTGTSAFTLSLPLSNGITLGMATVYANVYTKQPKDGGLAYCPEKTTTFTITSTSSTQYSQNQQRTADPTSTSGSYSLTFRIYSNYARLGNYTIYATSQYQIMYLTAANTQFRVVLEGDVNNDNTVDIFDLVIVGSAYGSAPGSPNWDPRADINNDEIVDIFDIVIVGSNFGRTVRQ